MSTETESTITPVPDSDGNLGKVIHQKNENCQVFNGPMSGCVFAMPGSNVSLSPTQHVSETPKRDTDTPKSGEVNRFLKAAISPEMVKEAALYALVVKDEKDEYAFKHVYYWQSIYRILDDEGYVDDAVEFTKLVQHHLPEDVLPTEMKRFYLKDVTCFRKYNVGNYVSRFEGWTKIDPKTGETDGRYLVAEAFKKKLDELRVKAAAEIKSKNSL